MASPRSYPFLSPRELSSVFTLCVEAFDISIRSSGSWRRSVFLMRRPISGGRIGSSASTLETKHLAY